MPDSSTTPRFGYWDGCWQAAARLYSLRQVLSEVRQAGYDGIELGAPLQFLGSAASLRTLLEDLSLQVASLVVPTLATDARQHVDYAAQFGVKTLMVGGGARAPVGADQASVVAPYAQALGDLAEYARQYGMDLAQHTHPRSVTGTIEEALLLLGQVPDSVGICADVAHLRQAGSDPVHAIRTLGAHLKHLHLKDYRVATDALLELGLGDVDLAGVMRACHEVGYRGWYTVELDQSRTTPLESAIMSRRYLASIGF